MSLCPQVTQTPIFPTIWRKADVGLAPSLLLFSFCAFVLMTSGAALGFRHLNPCSLEVLMADAPLQMPPISVSLLYSGAAPGPRVPAFVVRSPWSSRFWMWRAILNGYSGSCFPAAGRTAWWTRKNTGFGAQQENIRSVASPLTRRRPWGSSGLLSENGRMIPTSQTHDGGSLKQCTDMP